MCVLLCLFLSFQSTTTSSSVQSSNAESSSNRTRLIVGLVVGIVGFFLLLGAIIVAILCLKSKSATAGKKPISRAKVVGQTDRDTLQSRVQSRNLRTVKLTPLAAATSELPKVPVSTFVPTITNPSLLSDPNSTLGTPAKGIPIRLDSIKY